MLTPFSLLLVPSGPMAAFVGFQGSSFIITAFLEKAGWVGVGVRVRREKPNFLPLVLPPPLTAMHVRGRAPLDTKLAFPHHLLGSCYKVVTPPLQPQEWHTSLL